MFDIIRVANATNSISKYISDAIDIRFDSNSLKMVKDKGRKGRKIKSAHKNDGQDAIDPENDVAVNESSDILSQNTALANGFNSDGSSEYSTKDKTSKSANKSRIDKIGNGILKKKVPVESLESRKLSRKVRQPMKVQFDSTVYMCDRSSRPLPPDSPFKQFRCGKCLECFQHRCTYLKHKKDATCKEPLSLDQRIDKLLKEVLERKK